MFSNNENSDDLRVKYDLIPRSAKFFDLHMMFPLIQHLQSREDMYDANDLLLVTLDFSRPTNMFDYTLDVLASLDPSQVDPSEEQELSARREETLAELETLENTCQPLLSILKDEETLQNLIDEEKFNLEYLSAEHGVDEQVLLSFYRYGKLTYETGDYQQVIYIMLYFRELAPNTPESTMALWGKLASEILMLKTTENVYSALKDIELLQKAIDDGEDNIQNSAQHLEQLQFRSWLLHWSLFVYFKSNIQDVEEADADAEYPNAENMPDFLNAQMMEHFMNHRNLGAIQTNCPWLLRYLTAAIVCGGKKNRKYRNKLVGVIQQEQYSYRDPITMFMECLYIDFDFARAQEILKECEVVLSNDFFLQDFVDTFMENGRVTIFESYCRTFTKIDTQQLSQRIAIDPKDAEEWIVNLVRDAKLDAKIGENCVLMGHDYPEVYQQIIDRTKDLTYRTYQLANEVQQLHIKAEQASQKEAQKMT